MDQYFKFAFYRFWQENDYLVNNTTETTHIQLINCCVYTPSSITHCHMCALAITWVLEQVFECAFLLFLAPFHCFENNTTDMPHNWLVLGECIVPCI
jgi:hypothetical protein